MLYDPSLNRCDQRLKREPLHNSAAVVLLWRRQPLPMSRTTSRAPSAMRTGRS